MSVKPRIIFSLATSLTLAAGLLLTSCSAPSDGATNPDTTTAAAAAAADATPTRAVRADVVDWGTLEATRSASVTLRASQESRVASGANGRVLEVLAREGASVKSGDPILHLDPTQAQVAVDNAELALAQSRINLERAERSSLDAGPQAAISLRSAEQSLALIDRQLSEARDLLSVGAIASSDVAALVAQRSQAEGAVLQARDAVARSSRAQLEELALLELQLQQGEVALRQARDALHESVVRAPFDAEIAELFVEVGEFVGAGTPVARILGSGSQTGSFNVSPEDAAAVEALGELMFTAAGLEVPARIVRIERTAQQARLVRIIAEVAAGAQGTLPAGSLAEVRYTVPLGEGLQVGSGALFADAGRNYVFVIDDAGFARRAEVRVVAEVGNSAIVEAVAGGSATLTEGVLVINPRPLDVREGTAVRVVGE